MLTVSLSLYYYITSGIFIFIVKEDMPITVKHLIQFYITLKRIVYKTYKLMVV